MGFLIASDDGRLRICVATAAAAAHHLRQLKEKDVSFKVTDLDGDPCDLGDLVALSTEVPLISFAAA